MAFNEAQSEAVSHRDGTMMVLAGPGSGKTTVITHRVKRLLETGIDPSGILVITFTKAAALEMRERFFTLMRQENDRFSDSGRVSFGTFHSVFYQILKLAYRFAPGNVIGEEQKRGYLKELLKASGPEVEDEGEFLSSLVSEISYVKGERLDLNCYYSKNCPEEWFKRFYLGYEEILRKNGLIDFDDMLVMCYELFTERKDILAAWQRKFRYILIDEFQDINRLQYEIVKLLALPENNLFIVGDDDQSIYRFRGARPEIMLGFEKDYPDAKRVLLPVNYRSTREIVELSLRLISHNTARFPKDLAPDRGSGRTADFRLYQNPEEEAKAVASELRTYREAGYNWRDTAILFRTGLSAGIFAEKLMEYNVPFQMKDALPNIYRHWIARDLFAYLSMAGGDRRRDVFLRIMNRPNRYISRDALDSPEVSLTDLKKIYRDRDWMADRIESLECDLRAIARLKPYAAVNYIRRVIGYDEYLKEYAQLRRMKPEELFEIEEQLLQGAAGYETLEDWKAHVLEYGEELKRQAEKNKNIAGDGVTLATMHGAKGLEFSVVYVADVNEGVIPHHKAALPADIEEERRLFYVALTRAKDRLHLCAVRERYHREQEISRFVQECRESGEHQNARRDH